jgi:tetratricopeptide (TPR) repeat protein
MHDRGWSSACLNRESNDLDHSGSARSVVYSSAGSGMMTALTLFGRISVLALFAAIPAAQLAQPPVIGIEASPQNAAFDFRNDSSQPAPQATGDLKAADDLLVSQQYQAAIQAYSRIAQRSSSVWDKMGIAYQMLSDLKDAARCYKESLRLDPDNPHTLNNLATIEIAQRKLPAAERLYRKAIKIDPTSARVFKNLGTNLLLEHKYRESSEAYEQALALDPHIFDVHEGPQAEAPASPKDRGELSYIEARSCARAGLNNCAIEQLRHSFNDGFATRERVAEDDDFASLRHMPEYASLISEQK